MRNNNKKGVDFLSNKQNKYSIRKFSVGISSILIGSFIIFGVNNEAHAAEQENNSAISTNNDTNHQDSQDVSNNTTDKQEDTSVKQSSQDAQVTPKESNDITTDKEDVLTSQQPGSDTNAQTNVGSNQPKESDVGATTSQNNNNSEQPIENSTSNQVDAHQPITETSSTKPKRRVRRDVANDDAVEVTSRLVFSDTHTSDKHFNLTSDVNNNRRVMNTTFSFASSGQNSLDNGKLVYEAPKRFIIAEPAFSKSEYVTKKTDLSDADTWRYQFELRPISGAAAGEIEISQVIGGMIWSGPGDGDTVTTTMKVYEGDTLLDSQETNATFDNVKGGLYADYGQTKPTSIWQITGTTKTTANAEPTIGIISKDGTVSDKSDNYRYNVPLPSDNWFLENRDDTTTPKDYGRYTDFTYSVLNVPSWLELDPDASGNQYWTQDDKGIHMHLTDGQKLPFVAYKPSLRLKKSALTSEDIQKIKKDGYINVNLLWQTVGRLPNGQDYVQSLPADEGIKFKMINEAGSETGDVYFQALRHHDPSRLFTKADHEHETFRIIKYIKNRDQSNKYVPTYMHSIQLPKGQDGDYFTTFNLMPFGVKYFNGSTTKTSENDNYEFKTPFILYGVNSDGSTTKLTEWTTLNKDNSTYKFGSTHYDHLVLQTPVLRDTISTVDEAQKDIYEWTADVTYAVDEKRWQDASKDDTVIKMQNSIIIDQVSQNTVEAASAVPTRGLSGALFHPNYSYIHTKEAFPHILATPVLKNTNGFTGNTLNYNDKANVIVKANTKDYLRYLSTDVLDDNSDIDNTKLDDIKNVYLTLSAPDGTALGNVRAWTNNELIRTSFWWDDASFENTNTSALRDRPVLDPIKVIPNYKNSGRTLYVYKAPEGYGWNQTNKNNKGTYRSSLTQNTPEITFDIYNRGTLPIGSYSIRYAAIWDKDSELVRPSENQSLSSNHLLLSDVITDDLSANTNENRVSVIDVPFKIALAKEFASTLTIGKDSTNSFDKSRVDVNLGETVNLQTTTINYTDSPGILKEIIVTIPKDNVQTTLAEKVPDTSKYRVVYTTDSDVKNGTYTANPSDLSKVTAVKYVFDIPLVVNKNESFSTNVKVITVPEDAPILTKAHSQIFTLGTDDLWLAGNKVTLETEDNRGDLEVRYTDEEGNTIQNNTTSKGVKNTEYNVDIPQIINNNNHHYKFVKVDDQLDPTTGHYEKKQTKVVHLIYKEAFEGSVYADFKTIDGEILSPQVTILDHQVEGTRYTTTEPTIPDKVTYEDNENGRIKKTVHYHLTGLPENQSGEVVGNQDITVHYVYEPITTYEQVPDNPPQYDLPELKVTRYVDTDGNEVQDAVEGTQQPPDVIGDQWQYTSQMTEEDGITTYVYEKIKTELPNEAPQYDLPELKVTRYVDTDGNEVQDAVEGTQQPPDVIGDQWQYTSQMTEEDGITTYVYEKIKTELPNEAPQYDLPELKVTRYVDTDGNELKDPEEGIQTPPSVIGDQWQYTSQMIEEDGITTYVYKKIKTELPNEAPYYDLPQLQVTCYVDKHGNPIMSARKGKQNPYANIPNGWRYTGIVEEHDGITTYVYEKVKEQPAPTPKCKKVVAPIKSDKKLCTPQNIKVTVPMEKEHPHKATQYSTSHKMELPETGKTEGNTSIFASVLLTLGTLFMFRKKDRKTKTQ
ncbi:YSIRK signal domain/LPXTG anchor domain surface protein [Staphylococcus devriesei]|uniref:YSIRK signal domain/LPXTG anchor domain surface protein n=1 Tax=Staphylococcus devriesei TaxID=586733 RepID=A0A2T4KTS2_9STAP|nr:YSIRK signal domain/LPXTG anchor domain surface protein [Staphylococcus devriesei]PTF12982.1 YSIRK signal domain/LPXTG anchor domain surface protein [Staphylococcus devriesei]